MQITIDNKSGFCFGVVNAIRISEEELAKDQLACLGDIVHNSKEVERLSKLGLHIISHDELPNWSHRKVLIRAHGEPPSTYKTARNLNLKIIDATCPIVLKLQERIQKSYQEMEAVNGQVVIFGKEGHAEVIGLLGQTDGKAILITGADDIEKIDFSCPVRLYSQTTKDLNKYNAIGELIEQRMHLVNGESIDFKKYNTICGQMSGRAPRLEVFSKEHEAVVFVGGTKSSNAAVLFSVCKAANPNSHFVPDASALKEAWFEGINDVGISGATSTPMWLMEEVAEAIKLITKEK